MIQSLIFVLLMVPTSHDALETHEALVDHCTQDLSAEHVLTDAELLECVVNASEDLDSVLEAQGT